MNNQGLSKIIKGIKVTLSKHSPEILTGIGIAGMLTTTVLAVKATPKALILIEQKKEELSNEKFDKEINKDGRLRDYHEVTKLNFLDTVKTTWKCYIPAAVTATASVACLIGASSVHLKRNAVLATAYQLSETALTEYREKVIETIGEKKEEAIRDKVNEERIKKNPVSKNEVVITEKGNTLCYDHMSGRYFKSDIDKINKAVNKINEQILHEYYASLNDLYSELGLYTISLGDKLGWNSDMGLIELHLSSHITDEGQPCLVLDFNKSPKYDYDKFM